MHALFVTSALHTVIYVRTQGMIVLGSLCSDVLLFGIA